MFYTLTKYINSVYCTQLQSYQLLALKGGGKNEHFNQVPRNTDTVLRWLSQRRALLLHLRRQNRQR